MHARSYLWFSYTKHKQLWLKNTSQVHPISLPLLSLTAATGDAAWSSLGTTQGSSLSCSQDPDWLCRRGWQDGQCEDKFKSIKEKFKSIKERMFSNSLKGGIKTTTQHIITVRVYWECRPYLCMCACMHACKNVCARQWRSSLGKYQPGFLIQQKNTVEASRMLNHIEPFWPSGDKTATIQLQFPHLCRLRMFKRFHSHLGLKTTYIF